MTENNYNISADFDDLFEGREWIVTKNEKDTIKVSSCAEDEAQELYVTKTDWLVKKIDNKQNEGTKFTNSDDSMIWKRCSTAMFLIRDLLNCETENGSFIFKNMYFRDVLICGTVVSLSARSDNYSITVDDGTSSIVCLMKEKQFNTLKMSAEQNQKNIELVEAFQANPEDPMLKATIMVMRSLQDLDKNVPNFNNLKLGDIVIIIGNLSEHKNSRNIFIKSIEKEPEGSIYHINYLEELLNLYTNRYSD